LDTVLQDCLPEEQKYLSKIIGFMGPNNVFEPLIKLGFSEYFKQEAVAYHNSSHILKSIWKEMWDMKLKFAEVIKYKNFSDLSHAAEDSLVVLDYQKFLKDIDSQESYLLCLFGGHEKLERAIEMVEHTNLYQRFAQELKNESLTIILLRKIFHPSNLPTPISHFSERSKLTNWISTSICTIIRVTLALFSRYSGAIYHL
jgi:hypothetical protein